MKRPCHTLPMGYACMLCKCSNSILSNYKDDDIAPELAKLDEMMSSIAREMEDDSSLAATVVTAFLKKEHTLAQENPSNTVYITQVENPSLYCQHNKPFILSLGSAVGLQQTVYYSS